MFQNAAEALFSIICDIENVNPEVQVEVEINSQSIDELLYDWLSHLLTESEIKEMFFSKFKITEFETKNGFHLTGMAYGEPMTPEKGETVVKGVTYYKLKVEDKNDKIAGRVTLDI